MEIEASNRISGQSASPGYAHGRVVALEAAIARRRHAAGSADEMAALRSALSRAAVEVGAMSDAVEGEARDMLGFQLAMLEDEALAEGAFAAIMRGEPADAAWLDAMQTEIEGYEGSEDEYFRARAADLADIRDRVLAALTGAAAQAIPPGAIVAGDDITPSRFLATDWTGGAILLRQGSATSHVAMLARSRGVPMIVGLPQAELNGREVLVDAVAGEVTVDPTAGERSAFLAAMAKSEARDREAAAYLLRPAITADGTRIGAMINVADARELSKLDPAICDGIGLVRTELLFEGGALPTEDEQAEVYGAIVRWARGRPVTFRTLDAGGDKPIPGLTPRDESNPFLGVRGVRLTLAREDVFLPQLKALARAAALGEAEVMIPMVSEPWELEASRALLRRACAELAARDVPHRMPPLGMMVEVPAAALTVERFDAAFFSIGSNDLTQYAMAAGRDIAAVARLADPANPGVLKLIRMVAEHGARCGAKVSLCGDAGGDERLIPLLLQHGVRTLSMSPRLLAAAKKAIAQVNIGTHEEAGRGRAAGR